MPYRKDTPQVQSEVQACKQLANCGSETAPHMSEFHGHNSDDVQVLEPVIDKSANVTTSALQQSKDSMPTSPHSEPPQKPCLPLKIHKFKWTEAREEMKHREKFSDMFVIPNLGMRACLKNEKFGQTLNKAVDEMSQLSYEAGLFALDLIAHKCLHDPSNFLVRDAQFHRDCMRTCAG